MVVSILLGIMVWIKALVKEICQIVICTIHCVFNCNFNRTQFQISLFSHRHSTDTTTDRLTVHACTIAKGSTVYFNWGLIHGPVGARVVFKWLQLAWPGRQPACSRGITAGLADKTGPKTTWNDVIWPYKFSWIGRSDHFVPDCLWYWLPGLWSEINYLKWRAFQLSIHWRVHPLNGLGWL